MLNFSNITNLREYNTFLMFKIVLPHSITLALPKPSIIFELSNIVLTPVSHFTK